jgi:uncharacterized Zn-finger protein
MVIEQVPPIITTTTATETTYAIPSTSSTPSSVNSTPIISISQPPQPPPIITQRTVPFNGTTPFNSNEKPPSWMLPNDRVLNTPTITSNTSKRSRLGHGRSVSEFTLPPLSSFNTTPTTTLSTTTTTITSTNNTLITPAPRMHRRAVSANTIDFMLTPSPITPFERSPSHSPQETAIHHMNNNSSSTTTSLFEPMSDSKSTTSGGGEGRYVCPYCQKKFSRPSSLRIHTYSHTGEKPFVCTEPGCGRHFSVQSNMRRHLRVHRLGRSVNTPSSSLTTTNEE